MNTLRQIFELYIASERRQKKEGCSAKCVKLEVKKYREVLKQRRLVLWGRRWR